MGAFVLVWGMVTGIRSGRYMERIILPIPGDFMPKMGNRQNDTFGAYGLLDIRQNSDKK